MLTEDHLRAIEARVAGVIEEARVELEQDGSITPRFVLFSQGEGEELNLEYLFAPAYAATPPGRGRDFMGELLRDRAAELHAIAYLSVLEVWSLKGTQGRRPDTKGYLDWSTHPDRIEQVVAMLETSVGVSIAHMPILRKPGRPPTFAPGAAWEMQTHASGRVIGILPGARGRRDNDLHSGGA